MSSHRAIALRSLFAAVVLSGWLSGQEQAAKLTASDADSNDAFGASVDVDGDFLIVGARFGNSPSQDSGTAYAFRKDPVLGWVEESVLQASDGSTGDFLGTAVALSGTRALVAAPSHNGPAGLGVGAIYVFDRQPNGHWLQTDWRFSEFSHVGDQFGSSVALDGDVALVSSPGGGSTPGAGGGGVGFAEFFERDPAGDWQFQQVVSAGSNGAFGDVFGESVALRGDIAFIGAAGDDDVANNAGAVYVFTRNPAGTWSEHSKLVAWDGSTDHQFGRDVSVDGDLLLVGTANAEAVYVFRRDAAGTWNQEQKLQPAGGAATPARRFGRKVSLRGDIAVIGASRDEDGGAEAGAVYVFERDGFGTWSQAAKLLASDASNGSHFGSAVEHDAGTIVVGASGESSAAALAGAAYVFSPACTLGEFVPLPVPDRAPGCPGSNDLVPSLGAAPGSTVPTIGTPFSLRLSSLPASSLPYVTFSFTPLSLPPLDLAPIGMNGCILVTNLEVTAGPLSVEGTHADFGFTIPNVAAMIGLVFFNQGVIVDRPGPPASWPNLLGITLSNGRRATIGACQ